MEKPKIKAFLMLLGLLLTYAFPADASVISLKVTLEDGSIAVYQLNNRATVNFSEGDIVLSDQTDQIRIPLDNLLKWEYDVTTSGNKDESFDSVAIKFAEGVLKISGLEADNKISVYTIDGTELYSAVSQGSTILIPTSDWANGLYIVKYSGIAVKIVKQ